MSYPHGTAGGYTNHGCRCSDCTRAHTEYQRRWQARKSPDDATAHGTRATYIHYRCRCDDCRAASAEYRRSWRLAKQVTP